jgi:hypothetical protein
MKAATLSVAAACAYVVHGFRLWRLDRRLKRELEAGREGDA